MGTIDLLTLQVGVQVPKNHILPQPLYYKYKDQNPKYPSSGCMDPSGYSDRVLGGWFYTAFSLPYELSSKLLVSPLISHLLVRYTTPFKEFRRLLICGILRTYSDLAQLKDLLQNQDANLVVAILRVVVFWVSIMGGLCLLGNYHMCPNPKN